MANMVTRNQRSDFRALCGAGRWFSGRHIAPTMLADDRGVLDLFRAGGARFHLKSGDRPARYLRLFSYPRAGIGVDASGATGACGFQTRLSALAQWSSPTIRRAKPPFRRSTAFSILRPYEVWAQSSLPNVPSTRKLVRRVTFRSHREPCSGWFAGARRSRQTDIYRL
jgi:hypothetical protein